jgi:hypothetical protein
LTATRYDALIAREYESNGEKKVAFTKIGVAFPMKEKDGFNIHLEAIPAPQDGVYRIMLMPPKPRDDARETPSRAPAGGAGRMAADVDDGEIPFIAEWR